MSSKISDKISESLCLVAGAGGLIGSACSKAIHQAGAQVISLDREFKRDVAGRSIRVDLLDEANLSKTIDDALGSAPDATDIIFVHCAYPRTPDWGKLGFENVSLQAFNENCSLQLGGTFLWNRIAVSALRKRGKAGSIINLSSIYGIVGPDLRVYDGTSMQNPSPYAAIKSGVIGLTRYIAATYGKHGIRANVVCPGGVADSQPENFVHAYEARTPLGRMAQPSDVAAAVVFLASPQAAYLTGTVLPVDGGWTAW